MSKLIIFLGLLLVLVAAEYDRQIQCLNSCSVNPALLGRELTIGDCCGFKKRNGGGFILEGVNKCINCTDFRSKLTSF